MLRISYKTQVKNNKGLNQGRGHGHERQVICRTTRADQMQGVRMREVLKMLAIPLRNRMDAIN